MFKRILFIFILLPITVFAQKQTGTINKQAQKAYEQANQSISDKLYDKAITELNKAISIDTNFLAAYQQLGDLYRKAGNYANALKNYKNILAIDSEFYPLTYFGIAESELNTGDYANAIQHFNKYLTYPSINTLNRDKIKKYINDCTFSLEAIKTPVAFKPINMGSAINTKEDEYLPVITADEEMIIFTRQANRNEDFFKSIKRYGEWSTAEFLSAEINTPNYNEGAQNISPDGNYLFFTGCNRPDGLGRCDIYISKREGIDWSKPFNIGGPVNTAGWESQPSISSDGRTLYFVSTRQGGYGGYDIWSSELNSDGTWASPVNLGPDINTSYDEQSPFIHPDNESLYFSSNGWPGLGNKDLFLSRKAYSQDKQTGWQKPKNLGFPINTFAEESGLNISNSGNLAFFSSNQKEGYGKLDIYSFELPEKVRPKTVTYVKGKVFDNLSKELLNARIQIINLTTGKTIYDEITDPENGQFLATLPAGKQYGLTISKSGYLFYSLNFKLTGDQETNPQIIEVPLQKIVIGGLVILNNIFFENNKYDLLPESKTELQQLILFILENPTVSIEIGGHTDSIGEDESNLILSENRAKTVYDYLILNKIPLKNFSFKGYGEAQPLSDNSTEQGRKNNRRTAFKITNK
jgi:outer membrane protein OmpA-like peptidoglycan-associated protein/Tol biopolymer transport system component